MYSSTADLLLNTFIPQSMYVVIIYYPLDNFLTQLHSDKEEAKADLMSRHRKENSL
jgi:hypothetical protein